MDFKVSDLLKAMLGAAKGELGETWPEVQDFAKTEFKKLAQTLVDIGKMRAQGKISSAQANFLIRVEADSDPSDYSGYVAEYEKIRLALAALELRVAAKSKNELTIEQIDLLRLNIQDMEQAHKDNDMNADMAVIMRKIMRQQFVAILTLELAKKRGESVSAARSRFESSQ